MGNFGSNIREVPAGAVMLPIMWGTEKSDKCANQFAANFVVFLERPDFAHPKPASLGQAISDDAWRKFHGSVQGSAQNMWRSGLELFAPLLALPVFVAGAFLDEDLGKLVMLAGAAVFCLTAMAYRVFSSSQNEQQDQQVLSACQALTSATGLAVDYRRAYTGACRPRGKQPCRVIVIGPCNRAVDWVGQGP
mmetsp:Transcript_91362/g.263053  ORF Transcript_91362/g.263053 Transcript_91362/m.263053 type:complete len:192 (+) Transcript_91362:91-666(+)